MRRYGLDDRELPVIRLLAPKARLPASRMTVSMALRISPRDILDVPRSRSRKMIGTSPTVKPARWQ